MKAAKLGIDEDVTVSDRISHLSDDLLFQILYLVPITDAVNTSILSKRWKSLWKMMPKLVYDANSRPKINSRSFRNFFMRSLKLHEAPVLQTLTLKLRKQHSSSLIFPSSFPDTVFRKLVVLKLHTIECHGFTDKSPVCFRSLKSLHLTRVRFRGEIYFCRLMSACPVLNDLFLDTVTTDTGHGFHFFHPCSSIFTISVPSLERLDIKDYTSVHTYPNNVSRFKINAPSLKYLGLYINGSKFEFCEDLSKLVEASLLVDYSQTDNFLRFFTQVEFLSIHLYPNKILLLAETISQRLLHLELCTYGIISRNLLLHLLKHSPKLQVLKLREIHCSFKRPISPHTAYDCHEFKDPPPSFRNPSSVPECLSFHLKIFEWRCYKGAEGEKEVLRYILQNAARLKTAKISVYSKGHRFGKKELVRIKELESVPKASSSCQLVIGRTNVGNG